MTLGVHTSVGVSGPHGFVERSARFVFAQFASTATRLTFVTIGRNVPRGEAGWREYISDSPISTIRKRATK